VIIFGFQRGNTKNPFSTTNEIATSLRSSQ
jgi:hypothetical protein